MNAPNIYNTLSPRALHSFPSPSYHKKSTIVIIVLIVDLHHLDVSFSISSGIQSLDEKR